MKRYIRETHQILEGLGFVRQEDPFGRNDRTNYIHSYEPDTHIRVYADATEAACKTIQARAHQIAGLGTSDTKSTVGQRRKSQRSRRAKQQRVEVRAAAERRERAAVADQQAREADAIEYAQRHQREIENLMKPGHGA